MRRNHFREFLLFLPLSLVTIPENLYASDMLAVDTKCVRNTGETAMKAIEDRSVGRNPHTSAERNGTYGLRAVQ